MNLVRYAAALGSLLLVASGCSRAPSQVASQDGPSKAVGEGTKEALLLPEWAPRNPSPEFLRAASILKPLPSEVMREGQSTLAEEAIIAAVRRTYPAIYELFGTLTDEQVSRFLSAKEIRIPIRSLTSAQRAAFDRYVDVFRKEMEGTSIDDMGVPGDLLVIFYKGGAREDLSNVEVTFIILGHSVNIKFRITNPDGTRVPSWGSTFATI